MCVVLAANGCANTPLLVAAMPTELDSFSDLKTTKRNQCSRKLLLTALKAAKSSRWNEQGATRHAACAHVPHRETSARLPP
jgi:hypothetical protein